MVPDMTWGWYAARTYEQAQRQGHQVHDRKAFEEAVAADGMRRLSDQAEKWWQTYELTPVRLAECLIDGQVRYARRRT